jgi:hypothetical protein
LINAAVAWACVEGSRYQKLLRLDVHRNHHASARHRESPFNETRAPARPLTAYVAIFVGDGLAPPTVPARTASPATLPRQRGDLARTCDPCRNHRANAL